MLDKKLFDVEYSTQNKTEVDFLRSCGIRYTFVKKINDISLYKYEKNRKLFEALSIFYDK